MRKKINIQMEQSENPVADVWIEHLIQRIIIDQLDIHHRLQAKLLYQNITRRRENND